MKIGQTTKKVEFNIIFSLLGQIITVVISIVVPRLFIVSFGSEVNGFINSLNQIFVYVALLEAGVGGASLQALYKPVSEDNRDEINGILSATHTRAIARFTTKYTDCTTSTLKCIRRRINLPDDNKIL